MKRLLFPTLLLGLCLSPLRADPPAAASAKETATREIEVQGALYGYDPNAIPTSLSNLAGNAEIRLVGSMVAGINFPDMNPGPGFDPAGAPGGFGGGGRGPAGGFGAPPGENAPGENIALSIDQSDISKKSSTIRFTVDFSHLRGDSPLRGKSAAFADLMANNFKGNLEMFYKQAKRAVQDDLDTKRQDEARAAAKYDRARQDADQIRDALRSTTHRTDLSAEAFRNSIGSLEIERQKLELDLAGMQARRDALDKAVAEQSVRADKAAQSDPVAAELEKIVEIRQKQFEYGQEQARLRTISAAEASTFEAALAEAKARLAERKLAAAGQADVLSAWNRQLLDLTVDVRERQARLDAISKMLDEFSGAVEKARALEEASGIAMILRRELNKASDAAQQAQEDAANYDTPPKITITPIQSSPAASN
jgi:hypothetical protein